MHKFRQSTTKQARRFTTNRWVEGVIRLGYFSRGVLYGLIGIFALGVAVGLEQTALNQKEILLFISNLPYGREYLIVFLCGLIGYSLWGFIRAILDYLSPQNKRTPFFQRLGYIFSGIFYASLALPLFAIIVNKPGNYSHQESMRSISEMLLKIPFGQTFLFIIGMIGVLSGCIQIKKATVAKKPSDVNYLNDKVYAEPIFMAISRIGITMRGILWTIIGIFAMIAAVNADSSRIKETNEVFASLITLPFGRIVVGAIASGFILFGIYSVTLSFWAALPRYEKK